MNGFKNIATCSLIAAVIAFAFGFGVSAGVNETQAYARWACKQWGDIPEMRGKYCEK